MPGVGVWTLGESRVFDRQANDRAQPSPVCERLLAVVQQADNDVPAIRGRGARRAIDLDASPRWSCSRAILSVSP
jgi:hypothetical protein